MTMVNGDIYLVSIFPIYIGLDFRPDLVMQLKIYVSFPFGVLLLELIYSGGVIMTKWLYKFIKSERIPILENELITKFEKTLKWTEDDKEIPPPDLVLTLRELGLLGCELITIVPRSTVISVLTSGATTEELWVFKRPVE